MNDLFALSTPLQASQPAIAPDDAPVGNATLVFLLILITIAGGFLRFWRLDHQSLWVDEWWTVTRIRNGLIDVIRRLESQGFPPGWYITLWTYTKVATALTGSKLSVFSPGCLRLLPAFFGTLTIPAMYLLARGLMERRGALLATLLTAVNPFLIYYSRDLKMYGMCMFCITLTMGLFLRWQAARRPWPWWVLFMLSGAYMLALHAEAIFVLPLQLVWLLVRPRRQAAGIRGWLAAVVMMSVSPIFWYLFCSKWISRAATGDPVGMVWSPEYTSMSWTTVFSVPAVEMFGFLIPSFPPDQFVAGWFKLGSGYATNAATRSIPWLASAERAILWAAVGLLAVSMVSRRSHEHKTPLIHARFWWLALWAALPMACLALTWIPASSLWHRAIFGAKFGISIWEPRYLGVCCPAFILMATLLLRNLPTRVFRSLCIGGVLCVCVLSALSNHLIYRQLPWSQVVEDIPGLVEKDNPMGVQVFSPETRNSYGAESGALLHQLGVRPDDWKLVKLEDKFVHWCPEYHRDDRGAVAQFLQSANANAQTHSIVLVDFNGDLACGEWSDDVLGKMVPQFLLAKTKNYRWHMEWRYYIYNNVRVRIWRRVGAVPQADGHTTATAPRRDSN